MERYMETHENHCSILLFDGYSCIRLLVASFDGGQVYDCFCMFAVWQTIDD